MSFGLKKSPGVTNTNKSIPRHIVVQLQNLKNTEKLLKTSQRKDKLPAKKLA